MDRKKVAEAISKALEDKGKRKFTQSVEMIVNFRGIDFTKAENRLNLDILLPKGKGKEQKIVVFADGQMALEAKNAGASEVIDASGIAKLAADKGRLAIMSKSCEFIAQPSLMIQVGKSLGQVLGARGRLPRPIVGQVKDAVAQAKSRVRLVSKGKYLPVAQCLIGSEAMEIQDLAENFDMVYDKVKAKATEPNIKSIYVKLTMGKPIKAA
ncbi:MAG: 50S ribosomal protein L1 [Candidatus Micrarchaeia archaeon]|jgi:large subunit ribosomal protein L1